jgi:class 3 adenylate cyclase
MVCPACAKEIPDQSQFCLHCGAALVDTLPPRRPSIDGVALIRNYIPRELAERILAAGKKIESERRLVTILFADVTGFTALSERLDPEDVSAVLNDCFSRLVSIVLRYEGTIDKFMGDGVMAIFGAPLAHENDPERAARCALDMMAEIMRYSANRAGDLPIPLGLHIGMHSGMVVAGNVGSDLRMDYSVIGDTVNLAARLLEASPRGEIYMSSESYKLLSGLVVADGPFHVTVRGKVSPVSVYRLREIKREEDRRLPSGLLEELVGRRQELLRVASVLEATAQRTPGRLLIRGEAGVGKSRLTAEIIRMARARGIRTVEGACSSFETSTPYYVWGILLRHLLHLGHETPEARIRERLHDTLGRLNLTEHEPYLATLFSIRYEEILLVEEHVRRGRIFLAVRSLLLALAAQHATVFVLEDLHWIDRFSQELLLYVLGRGEDMMPALVVLTFRNEYDHHSLTNGGATLLDLDRLSPEDARTLILHSLQADTVPEPVEQFILHRSEGNPFFIQEIIKTLLDNEKIVVRKRKTEMLADNIEAGVPSTIQGIIMARIDRLQDSIKEVLFGASAIGREFSKPLLEQVMTRKQDVVPSLDALRSLELILEKREAREFEYLFKHFLIQEVAYNTMLVNKRKDLHASIAAAIESLYKERLVEYYELLAFHYEKAELWDKAAEYLSRSGHKVRQMYSREESESFFERKAQAVRKLYQSASAKPGLLATLRAITPPLIAMLIPILPIFFIIQRLGETESGHVVGQVLLAVAVSGLLIWYAVALWYLGVVPFLRGKPRLYDLMEDRVKIVFADATSITIHFSEIEQVKLWDANTNKLRPMLRRILDPFGMMDPSEPLTMSTWFKGVMGNILPPYSFGIGSGKAEIHVRLTSGASTLRLLLPWLNTPMKSRMLSIHPFDTKEFYVQCEVALMKWARQQF